MLQLLQWVVSLEWRRRGAVIREIPIAGSRIWYAEFQPRASDRQALRKAAGAEVRGRLEVPTLVLFHGLGASGMSFHAIIPHLRQAYRVIVPDLPGFGWSRAPKGREFVSFQDLVDTSEKFLARVAPRGAYLAGNSIGRVDRDQAGVAPAGPRPRHGAPQSGRTGAARRGLGRLRPHPHGG